MEIVVSRDSMVLKAIKDSRALVSRAIMVRKVGKEIKATKVGKANVVSKAHKD